MSPVSVITTIFGGFCVAFVVIICWGKLVEDFGHRRHACAAIIVGTFWVMNHKLPGFGINPEVHSPSRGGLETVRPGLSGLPRCGAVGGYGYGHCRRAVGLQGVRGPRGRGSALAKETVRRVLAAVSAASSAAPSSALIGWTGANLFGYR